MNRMGWMVCVMLDPVVAEKLQLIGGEPAERMHITLAYVPLEALTDDDVDKLEATVEKVCARVASKFPRLYAELSGLGRFETCEEDTDALVALVDAPGLEDLRHALVGELEKAGVPVSRKHGFTPHITLAYIGWHEQPPVSRLGGGFELKISKIDFVCCDRLIRSWTLSGTRKAVTAPTLDSGGKLQDARLMKSVVEQEGEYCVIDDLGNNYGCFDTEREAEERLAEIHTAKRADTHDIRVIVPIVKADEEKRLVYGVVLEPDTVDAQGDTIDVEGVEWSAHYFMKSYSKGAAETGLNHTIIGDIDVEIVESYVAPVDFELGEEYVKKGSWVLVTHVASDTIWRGVKNGTYTGYSIGGSALIAD